MARVVMYSKAQCPYCRMAKELFKAKNIPVVEIAVDQDPTKLEEMIQLTNRRTVPQIFINDKPIGGYDDLAALAKAGKLDELLNS